MASAHTDPGLPGWLPNEVANAGRENLDREHVARYDAKEDSGAAAEVAYLRRYGLDEGSVVVDVGAGTGQFTLAVAPLCARVVAVDVSPVMLERLARKVTQAALTNVDVVQAGFLTPTSTPGRWRTSSTPATRCTTCPTPGRRSPWCGCEPCYDPTAPCACPTSSTTSRRSWPSRGSRRRAPPAGTIRPESGAAPSTRSTCAPSTPPSPGCSSPCSSGPASL